MSRHNQVAARIEAAERIELARRHGLDDLAAESLRMGESSAEFRTRLMSRIAVRSLGGTFSFARMLAGMRAGALNGVEAEMLQQAASQAGRSYDPQRVYLPWAFFTRDLGIATPSAGGYLVGTDVGEAIDILRPWSVAARAGLDSIENLQGNLSLPRTTQKVTGYWLSTETSTLTETNPQLGAIALTPKVCGAFVEFSRLSQAQSAIEQYVRRELLRTVGTLVDAAVINGTGASGQPLGLLNTPGFGTQSGTGLAHAGTAAMKKQVAAADAPDDQIAFIGTPAVRELLETRERATGSGFIWDDDRVASRPAYVSTDVPAATLICGAWSEILLALWGSGFEFEVNPNDPTGFKAGIVQSRVLVALDVAVKHSTAFSVATSIT